MSKQQEYTPSLPASEIYNEIIKRNGDYPYASEAFFGQILAAIAELVIERQGQPINIAEIGSNNGRLATALAELLPPGSFSYTGIDVADEAVENGNQRFAKENQPEFNLLVGDITQPSVEVVNKLKEAHLIIATYVAPSIGLEVLLSQIEGVISEGQEMVILDRAYTENEAAGFPIWALIPFFVDFIKYHVKNKVPISWKKLASTSALIYQDAAYKQGEETHRQNAPGNMAQVKKMIEGRYGELDYQFDTIGDSFILRVLFS